MPVASRRNRPPSGRAGPQGLSAQDILDERLSLKPFPKKFDPRLELMLCTLSDTPFDDENWIFE
ncbi:MAG: hypothetical protein H7222_12590 [Methylotenera sp.]|nr:hypothetical protein [Oligoflexia bacterium]